VDVIPKGWWPCPEKPELLKGMPIGQYHCPCCGMMVLAGLPHFDPDSDEIEIYAPILKEYIEALIGYINEQDGYLEIKDMGNDTPS